jgi:hypothetical protein
MKTETEKPTFITILQDFAFFLRKVDMPDIRRSLVKCLDIITSYSECNIDHEYEVIVLKNIINEISDIYGFEAAVRIGSIATKTGNVKEILERCLRLIIFSSTIDLTRKEKNDIYILWELNSYINKMLLVTTQNTLED